MGRALRAFFSGLPVQIVLCTGALIGCHAALAGVALHLQTVGPATAPLFAVINPTVSPRALIPLAVCLAWLSLVRERSPARPQRRWLVLLVGVSAALALNVTTALVDGGAEVLWRPFTHTGLEYYGDVPMVHGIRQFLREFVQLVPRLSVHSGTHPPGPVLFLWLVARLFGPSVQAAAIATIVVSAVSPALVYLLAEELYGAQVALTALLLYVVTPSAVWFGATSMDGVFAPALIATVYLVQLAMSREGVRYAVAAGLALALAELLTFSAIALWLLVVGYGIAGMWLVPESRRRLCRALVVTTGTAGVVFLLIGVATGYNLIDSLAVAMHKDSVQMGTGHETFSRYLVFSVANLSAFLIGVGAPTVALWIREAAQTLRSARHQRQWDLFILCPAAGIVALAFSTLYSLEVERIWLFLLPFPVIAAAKHLVERFQGPRYARVVAGVAGALFIQTLVMEMLLDTYW